MPFTITHPQGWRKRSVQFGSLAMLVGAVVAFGLPSAPVLYRLAVGLDLMIVMALGVLFVRLTRTGMFAD